MQDFECSTALEIYVLTKVHLGEATASEQVQETIVAQLLANAIRHDRHSSIMKYSPLQDEASSAR